MRWLSDENNENTNIDDSVEKISTILRIIDDIKETNDIKSLELNFSLSSIGVIIIMLIKILPILFFTIHRLYKSYIYVKKYLKRRKDKQYVKDKFNILFKNGKKKNTDRDEE